MTLTNWNPELTTEWKQILLPLNQIGDRCWMFNRSAVCQLRIIEGKNWYYLQQLNLATGLWTFVNKSNSLDEAKKWAEEIYTETKKD